MLVELWYAVAVFQALKDWAWAHPLLYPFILFVLACLVEIYAKDIRSFLHHWPRTNERWRNVKEKDLVNRLELLKTLHNDGYRLLIYLVSRAIGLFFSCFLTSFVVLVYAVLIHERNRGALADGVSFGLIVGTLYDVNGVLKQLINYDETVVDFQKRLSVLKQAPLLTEKQS